MIPKALCFGLLCLAFVQAGPTGSEASRSANDTSTEPAPSGSNLSRLPKPSSDTRFIDEYLRRANNFLSPVGGPLQVVMHITHLISPPHNIRKMIWSEGSMTCHSMIHYHPENRDHSIQIDIRIPNNSKDYPPGVPFNVSTVITVNPGHRTLVVHGWDNVTTDRELPSDWRPARLDTIVSRLLDQVYENVPVAPHNVGVPFPSDQNDAARSVLTSEEIAKIPTSRITQSQIDDESQCTICLKNFSPNEVAKRLPCNHLFHPMCIKKWLEIQATCPKCRANVPPMDPVEKVFPIYTPSSTSSPDQQSDSAAE